MIHRRTRMLLATGLSLALLGLMPGPTAAAAQPAPALVAPTAVTSKNVISMEPGKAYKVKMNGKTRTVKWLRTCAEWEDFEDDFCWKQREKLYVDSKPVLTRYSTYDDRWVDFTLAKVTSKETLINVMIHDEGYDLVDAIYRFNGKKLVKVADLKSIKKKLRNFSGEELNLTKAGSGKLTLRYGYSTKSDYGYRSATFKYSKGKLKK